MFWMHFSGGSSRMAFSRREARAFLLLVVVLAGLLALATAGGVRARSRPENPAPSAASSASQMTAQKVLTGDDARRVAALEQTIGEFRAKRRLAEAIAPAREVLAIRLRVLGEDHLEVENSYRSLASILEALHRPAEADPLYGEALKIRLKRVGKDEIARIACYFEAVDLQFRRGNFAAANSLANLALETCLMIERPDGLETAEIFAKVASSITDEGRASEAETLLRQALATYHRDLPAADARTADASYHLARLLHLQGKEDEAERLCRTALEIGGRHLGESHPQMLASQSLLVSCLKARAKGAEAESKPKTAADTSLVAMNLPSQKLNEPLPEIVGRSRGAAGDRGAAKGPGQVVDVASRRKAGGAILGHDFEPLSNPKPGAAAWRVRGLQRTQAHLPANAALVAWLDPTGPPGGTEPDSEHWACVVRRRGEPAWVKILGSGSRGEWTADDDGKPAQASEVISQEPADHAGRWRAVASALSRQWIAPLEPFLASKGDLPAVTHLIVIPPQALAGVPIEALVGSQPDSRPKYTVSYTPSMVMFARVRAKRRQGPGASRPTASFRLLALGDPVFTAADDVEPTAAGVSSVQRAVPAPGAPTRGEAPRALPGTRREVLAIAELFERPELLLGSAASEQGLDALAKAGRLREFNFIHLATHGKRDSEDSLHSALLLARDRLPDPLKQILDGQVVYDGELSAEQVLRTWALDAEMVTISACWSGVGHLNVLGDLGFSTALILKGAKTVVLSLWNVDDVATALLMARFYQNLLGRRDGLDRPLPRAEALAEAQRWLRTRTAAEVARLSESLPTADRMEKVAGPRRSSAKAAHPYEHPHYWAAFILIGDPE